MGQSTAATVTAGQLPLQPRPTPMLEDAHPYYYQDAHQHLRRHSTHNTRVSPGLQMPTDAAEAVWKILATVDAQQMVRRQGKPHNYVFVMILLSAGQRQ